MENTVSMSLEEYTKIILEKQKLELQLRALEQKAERRIEEEINDSLIYNLNKEDTISWIKEEDHNKLLNQFGPYSWTYSSIASDVLVFSEQEIKNMTITVIMKLLNSHLNDLLESEK